MMLCRLTFSYLQAQANNCHRQLLKMLPIDLTLLQETNKQTRKKTPQPPPNKQTNKALINTVCKLWGGKTYLFYLISLPGLFPVNPFTLNPYFGLISCLEH